MERDVNEALGQQHVSEHVETLQEKGSDVVKSQDELVKPGYPSQPSRHSPISPIEGMKSQDGHELTINGQSSARRPPGEMVRGESYGEVLPCSPTSAWVAEADKSDDEIMAAVEDEEEVEQGRPAHTRKPPAGMTPA